VCTRNWVNFPFREFPDKLRFQHREGAPKRWHGKRSSCVTAAAPKWRRLGGPRCGSLMPTQGAARRSRTSAIPAPEICRGVPPRGAGAARRPRPPRVELAAGRFAPAGAYLNLKFATWTVPSARVTFSRRHVPAHVLSVFQTYVYWPDFASKLRPLSPA